MGGIVIGGEYMGTNIFVIEGVIHIGKYNGVETKCIPLNNKTVKSHKVMNKTSERITNSQGSRRYSGSSFGGSHWRSRGGKGSSSRTSTSTTYKTFTILVEYTNDKNSVIKLEEDSYEMFLGNVNSDPVAIDYEALAERLNGKKKSKKPKVKDPNEPSFWSKVKQAFMNGYNGR